MAGPLEFFHDMEAQGGPANTYVGELYFSAHRGTYTSQAMVKQNNSSCELALREMEMWSTCLLYTSQPVRSGGSGECDRRCLSGQ